MIKLRYERKQTNMNSPKVYKLNFYGETYNIVLAKDTYANNGTLAVFMYCSTPKGKIKEPFGDLTTNIFDSDLFANDTDSQFVDTNNMGKAIIDWLVENNIATRTNIIGGSGWCEYPLVKFTKEALEGMVEYQ